MKNLLLISLLLNLALAAVAIFGFPFSVSDSREEPVADARIPSQRQPSPIAATAESQDESTPLPPLDGLDHGEQVAALVGQGWTEEDAKVFALGRAFREQMQWMAERLNPGSQEYWRQPDTSLMDADFQRDARETQQRLEEAMNDLFGIDFSNMYGFSAELPFPEEQRKALAAMDHDYQMMSQEIHFAAEGFLLPEDHEALALLEEEKQKDLEALLSPEEIFEYRLRTSHTAMNLRRHLDAIEPTEEEFRTVFRLQYELDQLQPGQHGNDDELAHERYQEANAALKEELRETLGEDRYRRYERGQDWSYNRLVSLTKRLDLPPERVDGVFDLKERVEAEHAALYGSDGLSGEDQRAATEALREEVREDLRELLGDRGAELYEQQGGGHWLMMLQ